MDRHVLRRRGIREVSGAAEPAVAVPAGVHGRGRAHDVDGGAAVDRRDSLAAMADDLAGRSMAGPPYLLPHRARPRAREHRSAYRGGREAVRQGHLAAVDGRASGAGEHRELQRDPVVDRPFPGSRYRRAHVPNPWISGLCRLSLSRPVFLGHAPARPTPDHPQCQAEPRGGRLPRADGAGARVRRADCLLRWKRRGRQAIERGFSPGRFESLCAALGQHAGLAVYQHRRAGQLGGAYPAGAAATDDGG